MPDPHLNTRPVHVGKDPGVLRPVVERMKALARLNAVARPPTYSKSWGEVYHRYRNPKTAAEIVEGGLTRLLVVHRTPVVVCFTLDTYRTPPQWHLSLSQPLGVGLIGAVSNRVVDLVVGAFFGTDFTELHDEGFIGALRHFVQPAHDPSPEQS